MLSQQLQALRGKATPVGFEPARGDPIGSAERRVGRAGRARWSPHPEKRDCAAKDYSLAKGKER